MAATLIPLTTLFKPPSDCLASLTSSEYNLFLGADVSCLPSGAGKWGTTQSFSPALMCPDGWTVAHSSELTVGNTLTETRATCCPKLRDHITFSGDRDMYVDTQDWTVPVCTAWISGAFSASSWGDSQDFDTTLSGIDKNTVIAPVVQIAWQVSDLIRTTSSSASSSVSSTQPPTPASSVQTSPTSTPKTLSTTSGLSLSVKIAIGVIIPLLILSILALTVFIILRRRKSKSLQSPSHEIQQEIVQVESNPVAGTSTFESTAPSINDKYVSPRVSYVPMAQGYREDNGLHLQAPSTARGGIRGS